MPALIAAMVALLLLNGMARPRVRWLDALRSGERGVARGTGPQSKRNVP
jgi:hypothetical protein